MRGGGGGGGVTNIKFVQAKNTVLYFVYYLFFGSNFATPLFQH